MRFALNAFALTPTLLVLAGAGAHAETAMQTTKADQSAARIAQNTETAHEKTTARKSKGSQLLEKAKGWIGYPVKTTSGKVVGTLKRISTASSMPMLVVTGTTHGSLNVPLEGAHEKAGSVIVPEKSLKLRD